MKINIFNNSNTNDTQRKEKNVGNDCVDIVYLLWYV